MACSALSSTSPCSSVELLHPTLVLDLLRSYCTPLLSSTCPRPLDRVAIDFIDVFWASRSRRFQTFCLNDRLVESHLRVVVHDGLDDLDNGVDLVDGVDHVDGVDLVDGDQG